MKISV